MNRSFVRWTALAFATAALAVSTAALPPAAQAQALSCINTPGTGGGFTLVCTPSLNCAITPTPGANVTPPNTITLTASCTPAASGNATYVWSKLSGDLANCPQTFIPGAVQVLTAQNATSPACVYQVAITDGAKGASPNVAVSWTSTPPPPPTGCTLGLTTNPTTIPAPPNAFTATPAVTNCSPATGLTYSWTKNGTAWAGANTASPTDSEPANSGTGTLNFTYIPTICTGTTAQSCVTLGGVTASQPGSGGGGGGISCSGFNSTTVLNLNWASPGNNVVASMGPNDAIVVKFTPTSTGGTLSHVQAADYQTNPTGRLAVLSTQACDFGTGVGGFSNPSSGQEPLTYFSAGKGNAYGAAQLSVGTTYYYNIENVQPPNCDPCNMAVNLVK